MSKARDERKTGGKAAGEDTTGRDELRKSPMMAYLIDALSK